MTFACGLVAQFVAFLINIERLLQILHATLHSWDWLVVRRWSEDRGPLAEAALACQCVFGAARPRHQLRVVPRGITGQLLAVSPLLAVRSHVGVVPRIEKVIGVLDFVFGLLLEQLRHGLSDWLWHKL